MKKIFSLSLAVAATLVLAACGKLDFNSNSNSSSGQSTNTYQTTGTVSDEMYQGVIKDGRYQVSSARGLTLQQNLQGDNTYNIKSMENGLEDLSQAQFPTSKYVLQEGQEISLATARDWLGRESKTNKDGLNPADNGQTDPDKREPIYLQQILEQDYMVESGGKLQLAGISIALGMNKVDYYTKEQYGAQFQTEISEEKMRQEGEAIAKKIVARLRAKSGVSADIPILVGLYQNATQDSLVGGVFFQTAISKRDSEMGSWKKLNWQNEVLPTVDGKKPINATVSTAFDNFSNQVKSFFPTLAGITAQVHYENGNLAGMNITVNTQFYGLTEIESFTQYISTSASKYLPSGAPIEISVQSAQGMQAFVARSSSDKGFYTHVFGSY